MEWRFARSFQRTRSSNFGEEATTAFEGDTTENHLKTTGSCKAENEALALQLVRDPRYPCNPRLKKVSQAETGRGSADLREPSAAFTKLLPSSHIGPGNLRHSVRTSSSAFTNMSTSFSPMISGGRIFITSIACPATWVRMR